MRISGGSARGIPLSCPKKSDIRPSTDGIRAAVFSSLAAGGGRCAGSSFLDVFAGVGSYGLEAVSRGARSGTFVELSRGHCRYIEKNLKAVCIASSVPVKNFTLRCCDAFSASMAPADLIFFDPPYELLRRDADRCLVLLSSLLNLSGAEAIAVFEVPSDWEFTLPPPLILRNAVGKSRGSGAPRVLFIVKNFAAAGPAS
jgi:16S rRNA (guanine966-N2)-methyltransferase